MPQQLYTGRTTARSSRRRSCLTPAGFVGTTVFVTALLAAPMAHASADISVADASVVRTGKTPTLSFVVTRTGDTSFGLTVDYRTVDGTAVAGRDYVAGQGTLSFAAGQTSATVGVPVQRALARVDRSFTLALSNPTAGTSSAFATAGTAVAGKFAEASAAADFNGDGKVDVALASGDADSAVDVLRNDTPAGSNIANLTPTAKLVLFGGAGVPGVVDINRDGKPDLVVSYSGTNQIGVFINTTPAGAGNITFAATAVTVPDGAASDAQFADFDGDGIVDVAVVVPVAPGKSAGRAVVLRNLTPVGALAPVFGSSVSLTTSSVANAYPDAISPLDVNGDGKPDLAVANLVASDVAVLLNTSSGGVLSFQPPVSSRIGTGAVALASVDIDGDGRPDIVASGTGISQAGTTWSALLNRTATGATAPVFSVTTFDGGAPYRIGIADFDGDGKPDVALSNLLGQPTAEGSIDVYVNKTPAGASTASFAKSSSTPFGDEPHAIAVADFNNDGRPDVATIEYFDNLATFFFGTPAGVGDVKIVDGSATGTISPRKQPN